MSADFLSISSSFGSTIMYVVVSSNIVPTKLLYCGVAIFSKLSPLACIIFSLFIAPNKTATLSIFNTIVLSLASNILQFKNSLQLVSPSNWGKYSSPMNIFIFPIDLFKSPA